MKILAATAGLCLAIGWAIVLIQRRRGKYSRPGYCIACAGHALMAVYLAIWLL